MEAIDEVNKYAVWAWDLALKYAPSLALALVTLIAGLWIIGILVRSVKRAMIKKELDPSLIPFLVSLLSATLKVLLVLSILSMVGVQVTSFIAVLGAAGLAVGLALQGTLQNFAGGVMILAFRPYNVGDYIEAMSYSGTVKSIRIFNTILTTPDNKTIIIPNGPISNSSMINYSTEAKRRVDFLFGVSYGDDLKKVKSILLEIANADERVLKEPAEPFVALKELADSSVNFTLRVWVESANYWGVYFDFQERVKTTFDTEGISIPFPHQDVTLVKE